MDDFKIEKNIEIPPALRGCCLYPFKDLQIGDSFFVEGDKKKAGCVRGSLQWFKKSHTRLDFTSRFREENKNGETVSGVRVWRIE